MSNFANQLKDKYPSLFERDAEGKPVLPAWCIHVPTGWEGIVINLCSAINNYLSLGGGYEVQVTNPVRYYFFDCLIKGLELFQYKVVTKIINRSAINAIFNSMYRCLNGKKKRHSILKRTRPAPVKIQQIKEKFGVLCFYCSGGDHYVRGMISMAEFLSSRTCELTGKPGVKHLRNFWVKTLAEDVPLTDKQYEGYKPFPQP